MSMWDWFWDTRNMCLTFTIPIAIMAIGLLISWWKGHRKNIQVAALAITLIGAVVLIFVALLPIEYNIASGLPPTICLTFFIPFFVMAFLGILVAISFHKQNRTGVVLVESREQLLAIGSACLILSSIFFAGIIFVPYGTMKFAYHISITPSSNGSYIVFLPAPIGGDGDYSDYSSQMRVVKGSANFSFADTEWGKALIVRGRGPTSLGMTANQAYYRNGESTLDDVHLSLFMNNTGNRWAFRVGLDPLSEVANLTLTLSMNANTDATFDGGSYKSGSGKSTIEKGWSPMNMTMGGAFYD